MASTIQIKRTRNSTLPAALNFGELLFHEGDGALYVGQYDRSLKQVGGDGLYATSGLNSDITGLTGLTNRITQSLGALTSNTPGLTSTATWNNAAVSFRHLYCDITNTASAADSRLMDLRVGGSSKFTVDLAGGAGVTSLTARASGSTSTLTATVGSLSLTSNLATLNTTAAHGFRPAERVTLSGLDTPELNATFIVVSTPTSTSFTVTLAHADISSVADTGTAVVTRTAATQEFYTPAGDYGTRFDHSGALIFQRNLTEVPGRWGDNASLVFRQSAFGVTGGYVAVAFHDKNFLFNETLSRTNLSLQTYFLDDGSYYSGRSLIVSQDRNKLTGQISEMGGQTMIGASCDINAPAFKAANQLNLPGEKFRYCYGAYDAADVHPLYPAGGVYSDRGFGKNTWLVGPRGETLWGNMLNPDGDSSDPELWRLAKLWLSTTTGHLTVEGSGQTGTTTTLDLYGPTGGNSQLRLGSRGNQNAFWLGTAASSDGIGQIGLGNTAFLNLYNNPIGAAGVSVAIGVDDNGSVLTLDNAPSNIGTAVLTVRGKSGQVGHLIRAQDHELNNLFTVTSTGQVKIGTGSDPIGDPNAALVAAWNQHSTIYTLGSGFPSLKAICTDTGGATVKIQAGSAAGYVGTESTHSLNFRTDNVDRVSIGTNGAVAISAPTAGTVVPLTITGTSDHSGNLQDWKASTGVPFASVVALSPTRFGLRAGGTAYMQIGAQGSNFPQLMSSANGILIDTSNQSSGYANVTVLTNSAYGLRVGSGQSNAVASADGRFYVETQSAANLGVVVRGVLNQTGAYLDLRDSSNATIGGFDGSCNLRAKQFETYSTSLAAPTVVDNTAEFGSFDFSNTDGAGTILLTLNVNGAGYAQTKLYLISTVWAASSTWKVLKPISSSGPYSGNDCELDAIQAAGALLLRVRRTAGSTAAAAAFSAVILSRVYAPFTATGTTASVTPPTEYFLGEQTGGVPGNFGIGGWAEIGEAADADIPNGGIAWSTDTPNALKARTPAGTLMTVTLT